MTQLYKDGEHIDSLTPSVNEVINFLTSLFELGLGYGGIASARSALGNFVTVPGYLHLVDHPLIQTLLKGIGYTLPPKPRYTMMWVGYYPSNYTMIGDTTLVITPIIWDTTLLITP